MEFPDVTINMIRSDHQMTLEEKVRLDAWLCASMRAREFAWLQYKSGSIDSLQWESERGVILVILSTERNRDWWRDIGRLGFNSTFVEFVSDLINNEPDSQYIQKIFDME